MVAFLWKGTWQCSAKTACACPLTHTPLPGTHPKDPLQTKQKVLGRDYLLKLSVTVKKPNVRGERVDITGTKNNRPLCGHGGNKEDLYKVVPGAPCERGKPDREEPERCTQKQGRKKTKAILKM